MREYALYLFDFDNTLFDTRYGIEVILRNALPRLGVEYNGDRFAECLGLTMEQVFQLYCGDPSKYGPYRDEFMRTVESDAYLGASPFPETRRVLEALRARGKHIGIVSGKRTYKIVNLLEAQGMGSFPEVIVGFDETERHKPEPDPIILGMSHFEIPPSETLYIGDSPNDALASAAAGIDCAIVNRHNGLNDSGCNCTYPIGSLDELICWQSLRREPGDQRGRLLHARGGRPDQQVHGLPLVHLYHVGGAQRPQVVHRRRLPLTGRQAEPPLGPGHVALAV